MTTKFRSIFAMKIGTVDVNFVILNEYLQMHCRILYENYTWTKRVRFMLFYSNFVRLFPNSECRIAFVFLFVLIACAVLCSEIVWLLNCLCTRVCVSFRMKTKNDTMHSTITSNTRKDTNLWLIFTTRPETLYLLLWLCELRVLASSIL